MDTPRRIRLDLMVPAEKAIYDAMQEIEKIGADVRLTEAQTLLSKAKDLVSDFVDDKPGTIKAPFTPDQVKNLNEFQNSGFHPFTCCSPDNIPECERIKHISEGKLIATNEGWICPCGNYEQNWAHAFMANNEFKIIIR